MKLLWHWVTQDDREFLKYLGFPIMPTFVLTEEPYDFINIKKHIFGAWNGYMFYFVMEKEKYFLDNCWINNLDKFFGNIKLMVRQPECDWHILGVYKNLNNAIFSQSPSMSYANLENCYDKFKSYQYQILWFVNILCEKYEIVPDIRKLILNIL